jgi:lipopolysaccharide/colanic/teichoic acid biosynthesis glycosyltransferase
MQRILDVIFSFSALVLLSPFLFPVIIILRFTGEGEVFYVQKRVGLRGRKFGLLKFATMLKDSPNIGPGEITVSGDPRVLPFGKFLRKSKLNELPQIWNIFVGHMSIVGPRPMVPNTYANYPKPAQQKLNTVRPGLTGIGSIVFRDEERFLIDRENPTQFYNNHIIPYKSDIEIWYVKNQSLCLYSKIIFITAWVVLFPNSKLVNKLFAHLPQMPEELLLSCTVQS